MHIINNRPKEEFKEYIGVNWSEPVDHFTEMFYKQNKNQYWVPEEISVPLDLPSWNKLTQEERDAYEYALAGLTMLDTIQGNIGMPDIAKAVDNEQRGAVLYFMASMENIHSESYSTIFQTLSTKERRHELFEWIKENKHLQYKANTISQYYEALKEDDSPLSLYKAMVASVMLESFLFYSGFYYPLYMYGQGKVMQSGEIINLILRDESIHGVYVGLLAQEVYKDKLTEGEQEEARQFTIKFMKDLYENECRYSDEVYGKVGLSSDVRSFVRYNANKALANLNYDEYFSEEETEFSAVVLNGLNTDTKNTDFFSGKINSYTKATVELLQDDDFSGVLGLPQFQDKKEM